MVAYMETEKQSTEELNDYIQKAMSKVEVQKEVNLSRYIPGKKGHLHHFAFNKLRRRQPDQLKSLIKEHILEKENPEPLFSAPRADLMVKRTVDVKFKRSQINRLIGILKSSGDEDLIAMLSPHQTLKHVQKTMLEMINAKKVDQELWETYVRLVEEERSLAE